MSNRYNLLDNELDNILSEEEQKKYIKLSYNGDKKAREILFKHNLRLVAYIVERCSLTKNIDKEDLFQIGCIGLIKAIDNFDIVNYNNKFSTYAGNKILGEIRWFVRDHGSVFYIERKYYHILCSIAKLKKAYSEKNINLTTTQISEILNIPEEDIVIAINSSQDIISLSSPGVYNPKNDEVISIVDMIEDTMFSLDDFINNLDLKLNLDKLKEKEQFVIKSLYGINTSPKTQEELAGILNTTQSNISYIKRNVLKKLKNKL